MTLQSFLSTSNMSVYQEKLIEHLFIAKLMQVLGRRGKKLECLMTRVGDSFGYDLVLICDGVTKFVQMKAKSGTGKRIWKLNRDLVDNSPHETELIVVHIRYDKNDPNTMKIQYKIIDKKNLVSIKLLSLFNNNYEINPKHLEKKMYDIDTLSIRLFP